MKSAKLMIQQIGGVLLLLGAATLMTEWTWSRYIYCVGAVMFAFFQLVDQYKGENIVLKRLYKQLSFGGALLLLTGVLLFTTHNNEAFLSLSVAAFIEIYAVFRISAIEKKNK
ncbi:MAG: hypothetical protein WCQ82_01090 [Bacteroidaceae bacterium]|nr:hypothetical protein [Bacteroidaceae bacterium]